MCLNNNVFEQTTIVILPRIAWGCQESIFGDFQSYRLENKSIWVVFRVEFDGDIRLCIALPKSTFLKIFVKTRKTKKLQTSKNSIQNNKNMDFWRSRKKRISPSNSTRKTTHVDLFSSLYDGKSLKIDSWHPQTIRGRITTVVYLKTHNVKKDSISFLIYFCHWRYYGLKHGYMDGHLPT